jgi:hypothetical protein
VATHVKVIAAIFLFIGLLWVLATVLAPVILTTLAGVVSTSGDPDAAVGATILGFAGVRSRCSRASLPRPSCPPRGALLKLKPSARIVGIIMAAICLIGAFPSAPRSGFTR